MESGEEDYLEYLYEECEDLVMEFEALRDYNHHHAHLLKPSPLKSKEAYLRALESENSQRIRKHELEEERAGLEATLRDLMLAVEERRLEMKRLSEQARAKEEEVNEKSRIIKEKKTLESFLLSELERLNKEKD